MASITINTETLAAVIKQHALETSVAAYYGYIDGHGPSEHDIVGVALTAAANDFNETQTKNAIKSAWLDAAEAHKIEMASY